MRALGEGEEGRGSPSAGVNQPGDGERGTEMQMQTHTADVDAAGRLTDWRCLQPGASDGGRAPQLLGVCLMCSWQAFAGSRCEYAPRLVNIDALVTELDRAGLAQPAADRSKNKQRITSTDQNRERSR